MPEDLGALRRIAIPARGCPRIRSSSIRSSGPLTTAPENQLTINRKHVRKGKLGPRTRLEALWAGSLSWTFSWARSLANPSRWPFGQSARRRASVRWQSEPSRVRLAGPTWCPCHFRPRCAAAVWLDKCSGSIGDTRDDLQAPAVAGDITPPAGPSPVTSACAHRGAVRTLTLTVPPWPLAEWTIALLASSLTASIRSSARAQSGSASRTNRRAMATDAGVPGNVAVSVDMPR
jgi:hypothetical protein